MLGKVLLLTGGLCLLVVVLATAITGAVFRLSGLEVAGIGHVMLFCAIMCAILSPMVLGPLIWTTMRLRQLSAQLRAAAYTDALTGAPNRRAFFEHVGRRMDASGPPRPFSMLMIDVDRFKALNDRLGHEAGDAALVHVAREIARGIDRSGVPGAFLARLGGEEFAVHLDRAGRQDAARVAQAVCEHVRGMAFVHGGEAVPVTVSIGVWSGTTRHDADAALAGADRAAYAAKGKGRDRWELAGEDAPRTAAA